MKSWLKRGVVALVFLMTLIVLFFVEEDWRGARELNRVKKELKEKGETLDSRTPPPPPIPDEVNVAAAPVFAELYESEKEGPEGVKRTRLYVLREVFSKDLVAILSQSARTFAPLDCPQLAKALTGKDAPAARLDDVLAALEKYRPLIDEVAAALARPGVQWPVTSPDNPFTEKLPYLNNAINLAKFLSLRARAEIEAGRGEEALQDIVLSFRMAEVAGAQGYLINYLVGVSCDANVFVPLTEGLQRQTWNDGQLRRLDIALARKAPCADYVRAIRRERQGSLRLFEFSRFQQMGMMTLGASLSDQKASSQDKALAVFVLFRPRGWLKQDEACTLDWLQRGTIDAVDPERGTVDAAAADAVAHEQLVARGSRGMLLKRPFSLLLLPAVTPTVQRVAYTQARVGELRIACAVERYRLKTGGLPASLDALVPDFLPALPIDPIGGAPLVYRREGDGYLLYSIGWNRKDDGGLVVELPDRHKEKLAEGDWVWASRPDLYKFVPAKGS